MHSDKFQLFVQYMQVQVIFSREDIYNNNVNLSCLDPCDALIDSIK